MYRGIVVHWNNHQPIIDEDTFMRAFNHLSQRTLDGRENPHYTPVQPNTRPTKDKSRPQERPLCAGVMVSEPDGKRRNVGTQWVSKLQHYTYVCWDRKGDKYVWSKAAVFVDTAISKLVYHKLLATFDQDVWETSVETFVKELERQHRLKEAKLKELETTKQNLVASLETLMNPRMISAAEKRYEVAEEKYQRLQAELASEHSDAANLEKLRQLKSSCGEALENWDAMSRDEKRVVLQAFVCRIEATPTEGHGLHLTVRWRDNSSDGLLLPRQATTGTHWLPLEVERLRALVSSGAGQVEIARAFPTRKWAMIRDKYWRLGADTSKLSFRPREIKDSETYHDYVQRSGGRGLAHMDSVSCSERARPDGPG